MRNPSLPAETLAFLRYLGFDLRKPNEIFDIIEVLETERSSLYRVWQNFCGDTSVSLDSIIASIKGTNALSETFEKQNFSKNFSKTY